MPCKKKKKKRLANIRAVPCERTPLWQLLLQLDLQMWGWFRVDAMMVFLIVEDYCWIYNLSLHSSMTLLFMSRCVSSNDRHMNAIAQQSITDHFHQALPLLVTTWSCTSPLLVCYGTQSNNEGQGNEGDCSAPCLYVWEQLGTHQSCSCLFIYVMCSQALY